MTVQEATYYLLNKLQSMYAAGEASQITDWIMEAVTGAAKTERMMYKNTRLSNTEEERVINCTERLLKNEPVQYVLNEAWFFGMRFYVDNNVLIPRPETEELVEWIIMDAKEKKTVAGEVSSKISVLDIGTGSGCIAVSVKKKLSEAAVWACDISNEALAIAQKNATILRTEINFLKADILDQSCWEQLPNFDIIVSNPPYIPNRDKENMAANVLKHEPHLALFVPDDDALKFYKAITLFSKEKLKKDGLLYFEIHENYGEAIGELLKGEGFSATLKKDMQQKDRMIKSGLV
jgi:release factor glutamine methyltransferase